MTHLLIPTLSRARTERIITMLSIPNDYVLYVSLVSLFLCILYEISFERKIPKCKVKHRKQHRVLEAPHHLHCANRITAHLDIFSLNRCIPINVVKPCEIDECTDNSIDNILEEVSTAQDVISQLDEPQETPEKADVYRARSVTVDAAIYEKIMPNLPDNCQPDCPGAIQVKTALPQLSKTDVVRYLVARKGNPEHAIEMAKKSLEWRASTFPLKKKDVASALNTKCFFPFGRARDGSPVLYMRGGLYDNEKASAEEFALAAAFAIDWSLDQYPTEVNVTVVVHTVHVPGGPNKPSDMNFIKLFVQVNFRRLSALRN